MIEITKAQFATESMTLGEPSMSKFEDVVYFTGKIFPSVNGQAFVSIPVPGIINNIKCKPGQYISKGGPMFEISGPEIIETQRALAESFAINERLKSEYLRTKELYEQNISTEKEFIQAKSSHLAKNAKYNALKMKVEDMGLEVEKVQSGIFSQSFVVRSPISGYVSGVGVSIGQYVDQLTNIAEVIDRPVLPAQAFIV